MGSEPVLSFADLRRDRRMTLAELAKAAGYANPSSIQAVERGTYPRLDRAAQLAAALSVTLEYLKASIDKTRHESDRRVPDEES